MCNECGATCTPHFSTSLRNVVCHFENFRLSLTAKCRHRVNAETFFFTILPKFFTTFSGTTNVFNRRVRGDAKEC